MLKKPILHPKKLVVSYDILFQEKIHELIAMESQDESGNQVPLTQEDEDRIFLHAVEASSHGRYMYVTGRNKSSSFVFDASTSSAPLEAAHKRIRELESTQSQLQKEVRELQSNIQSPYGWRLQTEEMIHRMMKQMMEERERFRAGQLPPDGSGTDQTQSPPDI